jgi:hypothetical protein
MSNALNTRPASIIFNALTGMWVATCQVKVSDEHGYKNTRKAAASTREEAEAKMLNTASNMVANHAKRQADRAAAAIAAR